MGKSKWNRLVPVVGCVVFLGGMVTYALAIDGTEGTDASLLTISIVLIFCSIVCVLVAVRSYLHRILESVSVRMAKALESQENQLSVRFSTISDRLDKLHEIHSSQYRNLASSLSDDRGTQNILGKIAVLERRMVASIEANALLNADTMQAEFSDLKLASDRRRSDVMNTLNDCHSILSRLNGSLNAFADKNDSAMTANARYLELARDRVFDEVQRLGRQMSESRAVIDGLASGATASAESLTTSLRSLDGTLSDFKLYFDQRLEASRKAAVSSFQSHMDRRVPIIGRQLVELKEEVQRIDVTFGAACKQAEEYSGLLREDVTADQEESSGAFARILQSVEQLSTSVNDLRSEWELSRQAIELSGNPHSSLDGATSGSMASESELSTASGSEIQLLRSEVANLSNAVQTIVRLSDTSKNEIKSLHRHVDRA